MVCRRTVPYLPGAQNDSITGDRIVSIVSFNYTDVLDKAIDAYDPTITLLYYSNKYYIRPILNVHGTLNNPYLLMGVNDETQILNPVFSKDEDVRDYLVKPVSNFEIGSMIDDRVERLIMESHLIVAMGLSFGETDLHWWHIIGRRLKHDPYVRVILFLHEKDLSADPRKHQTVIRNKRREFLSKCGLDEQEHGEYIDKLFVRLNSGMFNPHTYIFRDDRKGL